MNVRLSDKTRRSVAKRAKERGCSQSQIVRDAIEAFVEKASAEIRPYEGWKHVIGIAKGLPPDLSERTGERVAKMLRERYDQQQG